MTTSSLELARPAALPETAWEAISACQTRLDRAQNANDGPQVLGCAKELAEAVAKVVLSARGHTPPADMSYSTVITQAHKAVDRQAGVGLADAQPVRDIAQGAKGLVTALGALRNSHGTGHGRAFEPHVEDEMLDLAVPATLLWCRWVLRRLEQFIIGDLEPLLAEINGPGVFYARDLAVRLLATDLPSRSADECRRLGVAVGQRALSGTFNVRIDGVDACAATDDIKRWPPAYREGVLEGLLLDREGYFAPAAWSVEAAARVVAPLPNLDAVLLDLLLTVS